MSFTTTIVKTIELMIPQADEIFVNVKALHVDDDRRRVFAVHLVSGRHDCMMNKRKKRSDASPYEHANYTDWTVVSHI